MAYESVQQLNLSYEEEIEDTKGVIRMRKLKNRQHNGQQKKDKRIKQQSTKHTHKTNDRVTRTPL